MTKMFIAYPDATLRTTPGTGDITKKALWGDWCTVLEEQGEYRKIRCRGAEGWVHEDKLQANQLLELNFVDVGQGDGCFIVTPQDKFILVDAGKGQNMFHFLNWRFNLRNNDAVIPIEHLIISHSDTDHYQGFLPIVQSNRFIIRNIHHNGIVERTGDDPIGPVVDGYVTGLCETKEQVAGLLNNAANRGRKIYPNLIFDALNKAGLQDINMLEAGAEIPGYTEQDEVFLQILGPVTEERNGEKVLKSLGSEGETKNGHSVIVKLRIGDVRILLGGDLNDASEEYLAQHYTGYDPLHVSDADREDMIAKGREVFEVDILKSCHHGSHKFIDDFLSFFNPVATIISSGDNETYVHPRPDTLGAIGRHSRGARPLIFSTELARSAKEKRDITDADLASLYLLTQELKTTAPADKPAIEAKISQLRYKIERVISVYGMITVRTDGEKVLIAQKKNRRGPASFIGRSGEAQMAECITSPNNTPEIYFYKFLLENM
ncbi:hypothetical protein MKQ70_11730 [Chitinophaga sedimenti]|uniref:hypothetical protein n=1 Tax=Chitinophaga sedimenti TaxID=2033606 RepID=UPI002005D189|nr:hypothetical protein [Chitinophaga sedimenti]MCK7555647.1 hypothetical protein [Chitinophaga sedimenti]